MAFEGPFQPQLFYDSVISLRWLFSFSFLEGRHCKLKGDFNTVSFSVLKLPVCL